MLDVSQTTRFQGAGRNMTHLQITTTTTHGLVIGKPTTGGNDILAISDFHLQYVGAGQPTGATPYAGIFLQRKVDMRNVWVDGFTNDGIYFAPWDAALDFSAAGSVTRSVFFAHLTNVWSQNNGGCGLNLRMGCNANVFTNCDFSSNGTYGFWQHKDGSGTIYGNTIIGGQCSYNAQYGYYIQEGTNLMTQGLYAEGNGRSAGTGYVNTPYDFYVGDNCLRTYLGIGTVFNNDTAHIRFPAANSASIQIWEGGALRFGAT